jgi:hypothetical protein
MESHPSGSCPTPTHDLYGYTHLSTLIAVALCRWRRCR